MLTNYEYIKFLEGKTADYVWQFTKQETDFSNIYLATKLYSEYKKYSIGQTLENFFIEKHDIYGITDRHRTLIIAQLYGLITKSSSSYERENTTPIFDALQKSITAKQFQSIVTEQFLKFKLPALTYSRSTESENRRFVFPVIFIYQVLKRLKSRNITFITLDELYTYVMTANFHSEIEIVVNFLSNTIRPIINQNLLKKYKDRSRIIPLLKNIDLFKIDSVNKKICINTYYETVMDNFLNKYANKIFDGSLENEENYKKYLYTLQNYDINLINELDNSYIIDGLSIKDTDDDLYNESVLNVDNIPQEIQIERYAIKRDNTIGAKALKDADYLCEFNHEHNTFIAKSNGRQYMEAHHIIPFNQSQHIWEKYRVNIDCPNNIVSLCPICHRAIHLGEFEVKLKILKKLYDLRVDKIRDMGLSKFCFEDLLKVYL